MLTDKLRIIKINIQINSKIRSNKITSQKQKKMVERCKEAQFSNHLLLFHGEGFQRGCKLIFSPLLIKIKNKTLN